MRLTNELRSSKPGDADALAKFNETVEPVILEYEKVVAALNKQLDDLRMEIVRRCLI
jgi:kinesin family protein 4/21/27